MSASLVGSEMCIRDRGVGGRASFCQGALLDAAYGVCLLWPASGGNMGASDGKWRALAHQYFA
eukprot:10939722-Alexandrium_andersonii.AAC.1